MKRYALTLDLKDDPQLIGQYIEHHQNVWPEIVRSIKASGIYHMEIYHVATRLFMIIEAEESFSFEEKGQMDADNPKVQEWELLMDQYQQRLPFAQRGEKWVLMNKIFEL
ncbi:L-rhamnose mutarotase [Marinoscillum sp.]|uniref:L-rhamnose mutarotase n=1 Tax=Marinoscillum sp. TaxID=2024838 RepID=UPI003BA93985